VHLLNDEHRPHMRDIRVSAFRYEQLRPFHPGRLHQLLQDQFPGGDFGAVLRSAGFCRLATRPGIVGSWDHVGQMISLDPLARDEGLDGEVLCADAADVAAAVQQIARALAAAGCEDSLDVRRAAALGELARNQLALDLDTGEITEPSQKTSGHHGRAVELVVHLSDEAFTAAGFMVGRLGNTQTPVSAEVIRAWCGTAARITIRPVIDLNGAVHVEQYEVPDRIKQQVRWTDPRCVYPHCNRPADRCDCDHTQPYEQGGATCTCNLAPLCRRHHRFKTHGAVTYRRIGPGAYEWEFQTGMTIVRDHLGTHEPQWPKPPPPDEFDIEPPDAPVFD